MPLVEGQRKVAMVPTDNEQSDCYSTCFFSARRRTHARARVTRRPWFSFGKQLYNGICITSIFYFLCVKKRKRGIALRCWLGGVRSRALLVSPGIAVCGNKRGSFVKFRCPSLCPDSAWYDIPTKVSSRIVSFKYSICHHQGDQKAACQRINSPHAQNATRTRRLELRAKNSTNRREKSS